MRRRIVALLAMVVMAVAMLAAGAPAFAQPEGSHPSPENSCGASNPEFGQPPSKERTLGNCGAENNPDFPEKPKGVVFPGGS
jgi:hypothetical protein